MSKDANGEPGALALCSTPEQADGVARRLAGAVKRISTGGAPVTLIVHPGTGGGLSAVRATGPVPALIDAMYDGADVGLYETANRHLLRHRRTWPLGEPTPGVSANFLTQARSGLSPSDYHRYWELEHGPRALRHHLGMWDYTQVSLLKTLRGHPYHGMAITQWPRAEDLLHRYTDSPIGSDVIRQDANQFTDRGSLERHSMSERILIDHPLSGSGVLHVTDARHLELDVPAERVWQRLGDFGGLLKWFPTGVFSQCRSTSDVGIGMTRTLLGEDGRMTIERIVEYRPQERMLQLSVDEPLPPEVRSFTCRYEVRSIDSGRCRLDWYPRAQIDGTAGGAFDGMVDRDWPLIATGLTGGW